MEFTCFECEFFGVAICYGVEMDLVKADLGGVPVMGVFFDN